MRWLGRWWPVWPLAGAFAAVGYLVMPAAWAGYLLSGTAGLTAVVCTVIGVRRHRPENTRGWLIFAAGVSLWMSGDLAYAVSDLRQATLPYPSIADFFYLSAYPVIAVGLFRLTGRGGRRSVSGLIDLAIVASGLALIYWVVVVGPLTRDGAMPGSVRAVTIAYTVASVILVGAVTPMLVRGGRATPSMWLLHIGIAVVVVSNITYVLAPGVGELAFAGFVFTYVCWSGAGLHPSVSERATVAGPEAFGRGRLGALAASTLLVPGVLFMEGLRHPSTIDWRAIGIGAVVLFLLVLTRMSGFVRQVQRQAGQLEDLAMRDELTGLANRRLFEERLGALAGLGSPQVAILDLNGFKDVNDRFGHAHGDRLLQEVGERLTASVRGDDLVARMGGDEFAVLVADAPAASMKGLVERLAAALRQPIRAYDQELLVGVSIGYADGAGVDDPYEVLRRADVAMYEAKQLGGGRSCRYRPDLDREAGERARLGAELRTAMDAGQLHLVYQPIVELPHGRIVSVEALVRWQHPTRGFVSPAEFIPVAEQNGLIVELGAWVLSTACTQAIRWNDELGADAPARMSVNASARQLAEPGFAGFVADVLAQTGLPADRLVIEVTETAVFGGGQTVEAVNALHRLGVQIALDDFGTGHSSLGLLHVIPVDVLKVDKSFVDNITMAGRHAVIATALIQVAGGLGLTAVAEGVETAEQAAELHRLGYRLAQGYHFGRPVIQPDFHADRHSGPICVTPGSP